ncbi:MAG: tRNA (5-methylaminomethyl-2-thiouridine)(34)-methyltransferase MnmD [Cytophagales bacterium]|nr:tRNA (5-methylaminomethyl-2-thiouridine)(34)-methyltransferase MnmD [Cytophagales bacterium]
MQIIETADGSHSLYSPFFNETYHSKFGALAEARHIYLTHGFLPLIESIPEVRVFDLGLGIGINAVLTAESQQKSSAQVIYHGVEKFPVSKEIWGQMNYVGDLGEYFVTINSMPFGEEMTPWKGFTIKKIESDITNVQLPENFYHIIYFNPFAPSQQPELWEKPLLKKMYDCLQPNGYLVTYSSKTSFRLALAEVGFDVQKLPGPLGKREMVRAVKP